MKKTYSSPETVAAPVARYSHAVRVEVGGGALVFVSGQVPVDAQGNLVGEGDITKQTEQVFANIAAILEANDATMADVVQTRTFLTDMAQRAAVNEIRARYFAENPPTSTAVEVSALARPEWLIEIEAVAAV